MTRMLSNFSLLSPGAFSQPSAYSSAQLLTDSALASFNREATSGGSLIAMAAGSLSASLLRTAALPLLSNVFSSSFLVSSTARSFALLGEVATFRRVTQAFSEEAHAESWSDSRGFFSTLTDFVCLKGVGYFLKAENPLLRHFSQASGMVLGGLATEALQLKEDSHQSLTERWVHASVSTLALEAGGVLMVRGTGGRLRVLESQLHQRFLPTTANLSTREVQENRLSEMSMEMKMVLRQSQQIKIELTLPDPLSGFANLYERAEKRQYRKHGLDFEYAVLKRSQLPYVDNSPGLSFNGMAFVVEDVIVGPEISAQQQAKIVELIAVHEYGEAVFGDHHQASLLEFEVARREGFLEEYLSIMERRCFLKFRDIALNRMGNELLEACATRDMNFQTAASEIEEYRAEENHSVLQAAALRDAFRWPEELFHRYRHALDEDVDKARQEIENWADRMMVNEQARTHLDLAAQHGSELFEGALKANRSLDHSVLEAIAAFYETFGNYVRESKEGLWNSEHIELSVIQPAVQEAQTQFHRKLDTCIQRHLSEPERPQALARVTELSFFQRNFEAHLEIARALVEDFPEPVGRGRKLKCPPVLRGERKRFWEAACEALVFGNEAQARAWYEERVDRALATEHEFNFARVLTRVARLSSLPCSSLRPWQLAQEMKSALKRLALEHSEVFSRLRDETLQEWVNDALNDEGTSVDVFALRREYGKDLATYPDVDNEQRENALQSRMIEIFDEQSVEDQGRIASYLYNPYGVLDFLSQKRAMDTFGIIARAVQTRRISPKLGQSLFRIQHAENWPLETEPFLVFVFAQDWGLSPTHRNSLLHYLFLQSAYATAMEPYPFFFECMAKDTSLRYPEKSELADLLKGYIDTGARNVDYAPIAEAVSREGREAVLARIESSFEEAGLSLETLLQNLRAAENGADQILLMRSLSARALQEDMAGGVSGLSWSGESLLELRVLKDIEWLNGSYRERPFHSEHPWHPYADRILRILSRRRMAALAKDGIRGLDSGIVAANAFYPALQGLSQASSEPVHELARDAFHLLRYFFFPQAYFICDHTPERLELFRRSGNPDFERAALFDQARNLDLAALEEVVERIQTDSELKDRLHRIDLSPLGEKSEAIPLLRKWRVSKKWPAAPALVALAVKGHLDALEALVETGYRSDIDVRVYRNRPDALPVLERFAPFSTGALEIVFASQEASMHSAPLEVCTETGRVHVALLFRENKVRRGWSPASLQELAQLALRYDYAAELLARVDLGETSFYDYMGRDLAKRPQAWDALFRALDAAGHSSHLITLLRQVMDGNLAALQALLSMPGLGDPQSRVRRALSYFDIDTIHRWAQMPRMRNAQIILQALAPYHPRAPQGWELLKPK